MVRQSSWTEAKFNRFLEEKRGQGDHSTYRPWLTISDMTSRGRVSRVYSKKFQRVIHLFTDTQLNYYYLHEWDLTSTSLKEQYPILQTEEILDQLDGSLLKRLKDQKTGVPHVMVTTFLITKRDEHGREFLIARSLKDAMDLEKKSTIERLEIQRRFFLQRGIDFGIVTAENIPVQLSKNIQWVLSAVESEQYGFAEQEMTDYANALMELLTKSNSIKAILSIFEDHNKLNNGTGLFVFRYLLASRRISINMNNEIDLRMDPSELELIIVDKNKEGSQTHVSNG